MCYSTYELNQCLNILLNLKNYLHIELLFYNSTALKLNKYIDYFNAELYYYNNIKQY